MDKPGNIYIIKYYLAIKEKPIWIIHSAIEMALKKHIVQKKADTNLYR